jgi:geranylgeranyl diphosphate synthase type II
MSTTQAHPQLLSLEAFCQRFNPEFQAQLAHLTRDAHTTDPLYGDLLGTMNAYMLRGGKRLRPYLTYLAYTGHEGTNEAAILRLGMSQEFYHNAWLIHDDLIDRDLRRHGGPNVAGTYRAKFTATGNPGGRHLADGMALLAGDVAITVATNLILESDFPADRRLQAATVQQQQNLRILSGEVMDVLMPTQPRAEISIERLLQVCRLKTAAYSFVAPLQIGAIMAGAPSEILEPIAKVAEPIGIAFQLADDLLGMFGNEQELGKSVLSDLREGKRTVLVTAALTMAGVSERRELESLLGDPKAGYRHLAQAREILESSGAKAKTEQIAQAHVADALQALPQAGFTPEVNRILAHLAKYTTDRRF